MFVPKKKQYKRLELIVYGIIAIYLVLTTPFLFSVSTKKEDYL